MANLFDPVTVGDLTLANRIALAPLTRNRSPRAVPTELTALYYTQRATAGLLITEATAISQQGQGYADVPGLYAAEQLQGWRKVTDSVHAAGGHIFVQLWHVGRVSHNSLQPDGQAPVAPSAIRAKAKTYLIDSGGRDGFSEVSEPRALEVSELPGIIEDYRRAVSAAVDEAGFDGVEIHSANGYLLDQFLRSGSNHRTDEYGGSIENRIRFPLAVTRAIVEAIGGHRTGTRISPVTPANDASDPNPQPLFEAYVRELAKLDLAYIHVVEGATGGARDYTQGDAPFDYAALKAAYREAGGKGAWIVNNAYTLELAQAAVEEGRADLVAFGKPFIANPDLVRRFRENAPLNDIIPETLYGGTEHGYTDYPTLG